jgi:hypothetical protein
LLQGAWGDGNLDLYGKRGQTKETKRQACEAELSLIIWLMGTGESSKAASASEAARKLEAAIGAGRNKQNKACEAELSLLIW